MQLYAGTTPQFIEGTVQNRIAEKLKGSFAHQSGHQPAPGGAGE